MMAAALAKGETILENAAREPEIVELAEVLDRHGGAHRRGRYRYDPHRGVEQLAPMNHTVMPDRIEAGTFMIAAAMTGGDVRIRNMRLEHLDALIFKLQDAGVEVISRDHAVQVRGPERIRPVNIKTRPYPGFPTDMQAQFMALMCSGRRGQRDQREHLRKPLHACLPNCSASVPISSSRGIPRRSRGSSSCSGAPVMATDLRASASLMLAGLAADNTTEVSRIYHLDRGYERIEEKLKGLGADIERVHEPM